MKKHRRGLRLAACLLTLAMCAALLCSCGRTGKTDDYTAAMPVIVVGSDNYPPFNYMSTDGTPTGIDVELATEAFGRLGYRVKFVTIDWEKKKELVENDTICPHTGAGAGHAAADRCRAGGGLCGTAPQSAVAGGRQKGLLAAVRIAGGEPRAVAAGYAAPRCLRSAAGRGHKLAALR